MTIATGFDFDPLPVGNVRIEFFGHDFTTFNRQIVTAEVIRQMPLVAILMDVALKKGPVAAREILERLNPRPVISQIPVPAKEQANDKRSDPR
jgi:hypothetical protein